MQTYTVLVLRPTQDQGGWNATVLDHVKAETPTHAAHVARHSWAEIDESEPDDYEVLAVFVGELTDEYDPSLTWDTGRREPVAL